MHNILGVFIIVIAVAVVSIGTALSFYIKPVVPSRFECRGRFSQEIGDELLLWVDTQTNEEYVTLRRVEPRK